MKLARTLLFVGSWVPLAAVAHAAVPASQAAVCRITAGDSAGSGTLVEAPGYRGIVATAYHVAGGVASATCSFPGHHPEQARYIGGSKVWDVAFLQLSRWDRLPAGLAAVRPLRFADRVPKVGEPVWAGGYGPDGAFRSTKGNVVGFAKPWGSDVDRDTLVVSSVVRPGDSGGPMVSAAGRIVGVLWGRTDSEGTFGSHSRRVQRELAAVLPLVEVTETGLRDRRAGRGGCSGGACPPSRGIVPPVAGPPVEESPLPVEEPLVGPPACGPATQPPPCAPPLTFPVAPAVNPCQPTIDALNGLIRRVADLEERPHTAGPPGRDGVSPTIDHAAIAKTIAPQFDAKLSALNVALQAQGETLRAAGNSVLMHGEELRSLRARLDELPPVVIETIDEDGRVTQYSAPLGSPVRIPPVVVDVIGPGGEVARYKAPLGEPIRFRLVPVQSPSK